MRLRITVALILVSLAASAQAAQVPFASEQVISTAADGARSVFAADVDGDGDLDVLSASWYDDKIAWYENLTIHRYLPALGPWGHALLLLVLAGAGARRLRLRHRRG